MGHLGESKLGVTGVFACVAIVAAVLTAALPATAVPLAPIYFNGPGGFGFDAGDIAGMPIAAVTTSTDFWQAAGDPSFSPDLEVRVTLGDIHQPEPSTPSPGTPFSADVFYEVRNATDSVLTSPLLIFTVAMVDAYSWISPNEFALNRDELVLVEYANEGTTYYFGARALPDLLPGESFDFTLTHVVADELPTQPSGTRIVPSPGTAMIQNLSPVNVPEPGTSLLLAGLMVLRLLRRRS